MKIEEEVASVAILRVEILFPSGGEE